VGVPGINVRPLLSLLWEFNQGRASMIGIECCHQYKYKYLRYLHIFQVPEDFLPAAALHVQCLRFQVCIVGVASYHIILLYCVVLYCIVLYCIVSYCIVLYCIVLYCIVSYRIVSYHRIVLAHPNLCAHPTRAVSDWCKPAQRRSICSPSRPRPLSIRRGRREMRRVATCQLL